MSGTIIKQDVGLSVPEIIIQNKSGITRTKRTGTVVKELAVATYDVSGGDSGTVASHGLGVYLPSKAVISHAWYDVVTTFTDGVDDSATIALTVQSAGDMIAALA